MERRRINREGKEQKRYTVLSIVTLSQKTKTEEKKKKKDDND